MARDQLLGKDRSGETPLYNDPGATMTPSETFFPNVPPDPAAAFEAAFPQARQLIATGGFHSADDRSLFERWIEDKVEPALNKANVQLKKELVASLEPRSAAGLALSAMILDFFNGLLPFYPPSLAQVVAALIVVAAYELRKRGRI